MPTTNACKLCVTTTAMKGRDSEVRWSVFVTLKLATTSMASTETWCSWAGREMFDLRRNYSKSNQNVTYLVEGGNKHYQKFSSLLYHQFRPYMITLPCFTHHVSEPTFARPTGIGFLPRDVL